MITLERAGRVGRRARDSTTTQSERDLLEELGADAAEGEAELFAAEAEFESGDALEAEDAATGEDGLEADDAMLRAVADALGAESEDEFFAKLVREIATVAERVAPVVGKVARVAAPVLSAIPHPAARVAAEIARLARHLRAQAEVAGLPAASVIRTAAETAAEPAARDPRARPVVTGLVARPIVQSRGAAMSPGQRQRAVRQVAAAARTVTAAVGPESLRALPKIAASVNRTAAAKGTPVTAKSEVFLRTAQRLAARPATVARLAQPSPNALRLARRVGAVPGTRTLRMRGPVEITIRPI